MSRLVVKLAMQRLVVAIGTLHSRNCGMTNIGSHFSNVYYNTFDTDRGKLYSFYASLTLATIAVSDRDPGRLLGRTVAIYKLFQHPDAIMSFEGSQVTGQKAIHEKLTSLPFQVVKHVVTTVDVQPIPGVNDAHLIHVVGQLQTDNDHPHGFSQALTIVPCQGTHVIANDIFRLALHNG